MIRAQVPSAECRKEKREQDAARVLRRLRSIPTQGGSI